jgi:hypothetical protein
MIGIIILGTIFSLGIAYLIGPLPNLTPNENKYYKNGPICDLGITIWLVLPAPMDTTEVNILPYLQVLLSLKL